MILFICLSELTFGAVQVERGEEDLLVHTYRTVSIYCSYSLYKVVTISRHDEALTTLSWKMVTSYVPATCWH